MIPVPRPMFGPSLGASDVAAFAGAAALAGRASLSFGAHTGEVVRRGMIIDGAAFTVAEAMAAEAAAGEVWASHVLVDLVPGSDLQFDETGQSLPIQGRKIAMLSLQVES